MATILNHAFRRFMATSSQKVRVQGPSAVSGIHEGIFFYKTHRLLCFIYYIIKLSKFKKIDSFHKIQLLSVCFYKKINLAVHYFRWLQNLEEHFVLRSFSSYNSLRCKLLPCTSRGTWS